MSSDTVATQRDAIAVALNHIEHHDRCLRRDLGHYKSLCEVQKEEAEKVKAELRAMSSSRDTWRERADKLEAAAKIENTTDSYRISLKSANKEIADLKKEVTKLDSSLNIITQYRNEWRDRAVAAEAGEPPIDKAYIISQVVNLKEEVAGLKASNDSKDKEIADLKKELGESAKVIANLCGKLNQEKEENHSLGNSLEELNDQLKEALESVHNYRLSSDSKDRALRKAEKEVADIRKELNNTLDNLRASRTVANSLRDQLRAANKKTDDQKNEVDRLKRESKDNKARLAKMVWS